ncbi:alkaline phosphatase family protein [Candidatus Uabimicrobium amorphum]|uniref:Nucleotide pyrophosphatase n=1 Tax=Uabimicrobium amorphum TaxID=2596890 RepID=A0A5S9IJU7_UABAM|nr:alkaline phosphatase family protein [Candidatus Uabimicrobium amorphum]BBM82702.1 nucleotide pyrophosphatase [Candidatus Uabimicrobium amorphum]
MQKILMIVFLLLGGCYHNVKNTMNEMPVVGAITHSSFSLTSDIYEGTQYLLDVPYEFVRDMITAMGIEAYVRTLPLKKDVVTRIVTRLRNPRYSAKLLAFILFLKDQYTSQNDIQKFSQYAKQYEFDKIVGSASTTEVAHQGEKEEKEEKKNTLTQTELIVKGLQIYDSIFLQNESIIDEKLQSTYSYLTKKDQKLITRTQTFIIDLLTKVANAMEEGEYKELVLSILRHKNKREALTISVIDLLRMMVLKNYRMFTQKYHRKERFHKWLTQALTEEMKSSTDGALIQFLQNENTNKRYAMHIVVDGLQGLLMKSLVEAHSSQNPFIQSLYDMHKNQQQYKYPQENLQPITTEQNFKFLYHIAKKDFSEPRYLPFFRSLYKEKTISLQGLATTPTISVRNLPMVKTGAEVAGKKATGMPNFHFVDRKIDRGYYFYGNDALLLEKITSDNGLQTMFQRLSSLNNINYYAQYDWWTQTSYDSFVNLAKGEIDRDFGEVLLLGDLQKRAEAERELRKIRTTIIESIRKLKKQLQINVLKQYGLKSDLRRLLLTLATKNDEGIPQYALYYNPWPDHFAHFVGPFSDEILSMTGELNRLDYWLGKISDVYKDLGIYERTLFAMAGDHGLTPVFYFLNPEKEVFEKLASDLQTSIRVKKLSSDEGEGPKINHNISPSTNKNFDVILASTAGGNFMIDLFKNQGEDWKTQPLYRDLVKWRTISGIEIDIVNEIVSRLPQTLDYLVVREGTSDTQQAHIRLVAQRGGKRFDEQIIRDKDKIYYEASAGNLLEVNRINPVIKFSPSQQQRYKQLLEKCCEKPHKDNRETWATEQEWRELTSYTTKPDSIVQVAHLYDVDIAGTINLFPREGIGYNTKVPGRHAGEHFHEKDAFVGFWGGATNASQYLPSEPGGCLAPTIYEFLTSRQARKGENGWGFDSVWDKLRK